MKFYLLFIAVAVIATGETTSAAPVNQHSSENEAKEASNQTNTSNSSSDGRSRPNSTQHTFQVGNLCPGASGANRPMERSPAEGEALRIIKVHHHHSAQSQAVSATTVSEDQPSEPELTTGPGDGVTTTATPTKKAPTDEEARQLSAILAAQLALAQSKRTTWPWETTTERTNSKHLDQDQ